MRSAAHLGIVTALFAFPAFAQTVAFLVPDKALTRYGQRHWPGFQALMKKLCSDCQLIYQNANGDVSPQQRQFNTAIAQGAKVIVLDPVDSVAAGALVQVAHAQGVKVVAYDRRPVHDSPADFYVSFDNEGIGYAVGCPVFA